MKRCPTCNKTFTEEHLSFCVDDGTPLVTISHDHEATVVQSGPEDSSYRSSGSTAERPAAYQAPGSYVPPGSYDQGKRRTWPWILGMLVILVVVAGVGIAAVLLARNLGKQYTETERRNSPTANANESSSNSNSTTGPTNSNANTNSNLSVEDSTPAPTDEAEVLSQLTDLEHEWTAANINADKKKLDRILGDDYVETTSGKPRGKAEYLKTIKRDTAIQKWNFEDLKVNLKSDRATLNGIIRLDILDEQGQVTPQAFVFTDKFVWRDGRWQATGSEVNALKE